ncbi:unnamed protein product [Leuciscus chuanchicus]
MKNHTVKKPHHHSHDLMGEPERNLTHVINSGRASRIKKTLRDTRGSTLEKDHTHVTNWIEDTLKTLFRKGLSVELQSELACRDEGRNLNEYIDLTIQVDNLIRSRCQVRTLLRYTHETTTAHEPMQLGYTHLHPEERERRQQNCLCLYCGQPDLANRSGPHKGRHSTLHVGQIRIPQVPDVGRIRAETMLLSGEKQADYLVFIF